MKDLCAIIITYNPDQRLIESCNRLATLVDKVIVVDNFSNAESKKYLTAIANKNSNANNTDTDFNTGKGANHSCDGISNKNDAAIANKVQIVYNQSNLGIATALNIGVRLAIAHGYKWFLTLDQDSQIEPDMIDQMMDAYNTSPIKNEIGILAPVHFDRKSGYQSRSLRGLNGPYSHRDIVMTSGNLIPLKTFEAVGFFDDDLFIDYVDHDFCLRVKKVGLKILLVAGAKMAHELGNSKIHNFLGVYKFFSHNYKPSRRYYWARNRIVLFKRHFQMGWIVRDHEFFFKELAKIVLVESDKIAKLKAIALGVFDGLLNRLGSFEGSTYRTEKAFKYFVEFREEIISLIPEYSARVMDLGCGAGATSGHLKKIGRFGWVCGVEGNAEVAAVASQNIDEVRVGDIEKIDFGVEPGSVDTILALDILEHLVDPWSVVDRLKKLLKPGGVLIVSIPNVQHYSVVLPLLMLGDWKYQQEGLLDSTHIRFFTKKSAIQFLEVSGLVFDKADYTGSKKQIIKLINMLTFNAFRNFFIFQNLIRVKNPDPKCNPTLAGTANTTWAET